MVDNKKEILSSLQSILHSIEFRDSATYTTLLAYLVNATLEENIPKEITIAIEVFEKDSTFNSNKDSTVRHHIHTLRKKLERYYKNEGIGNKIKFVIPKGHYEVKFLKKKSIAGFNSLFYKINKNAWIYISAILFLINIFLFIVIKEKNSDFKNLSQRNFKFWNLYFQNNYPTDIVIGNDFLLDEYRPDLKRYRQIRDWQINSETDLNKFLLQFPKAKIWQSEIKGLPYGILNNIFDLFSVIKHYQTELSFNMSSNTSLDELKNRNLIYLGEFQNLRKLNKILFSLPIRFQYEPREELFLLSENGDTTKTFVRIEAPYQQKNKYNIDYSVLASIPGPSNENFLFIAGFGYSGRLERTGMLKDINKFREVAEELNLSIDEFPQYFLMIFEVESIERTGFKNTIRYFKPYNKEYFNY